VYVTDKHILLSLIFKGEKKSLHLVGLVVEAHVFRANVRLGKNSNLRTLQLVLF
jgi:hypothetical protein